VTLPFESKYRKNKPENALLMVKNTISGEKTKHHTFAFPVFVH